MKLQALKTADIAGWLSRLMESHERYWWAVAWATDNKLFVLLLRNRKRIEKLVVGTHFCQTDPDVLERLKDVAEARMMGRDGDTFHPKVYLFADSDGQAWSAIVGSPNFTGAALSRNSELAVLVRGTNQADPLFSQLCDAVGQYWNSAAKITDDELRRYRIQHAAMARHRKAIATRRTISAPQKGPRHPKLLEYTWTEYASIVRNERHFADRVQLLEEAGGLFRKRGTFARMRLLERQAIAGLLREKKGSPEVLRQIEWRLFGSMTGMGDFQNRVKENDNHLSSALEAIPYVGDIEQQNYEDFVKEFRAAFRNAKHKGGVPTASRLLAMKRPDWFVCVDSRNARDLAADLGFSRTTLDFDGYWDRIVCQVTQSAWWQSSSPKGTDRAIWNGRAALLDGLYYRGLKGNQ